MYYRTGPSSSSSDPPRSIRSSCIHNETWEKTRPDDRVSTPPLTFPSAPEVLLAINLRAQQSITPFPQLRLVCSLPSESFYFSLHSNFKPQIPLCINTCCNPILIALPSHILCATLTNPKSALPPA